MTLVALPVVMLPVAAVILRGTALLVVRSWGRVVRLSPAGTLSLVGAARALFRITLVLTPLHILVVTHGVQESARDERVPRCRQVFRIDSRNELWIEEGA